MKEKILNTFRIIILSAILSTAIGYSLADFVAPSCAPPCGNTPPPINVGNAPQMRAGSLFITNKLYTASTVAGDPGNTATTKDYVDKEISISVPAGTVTVYQCPYGESKGFGKGGGAWMYDGCQGQISANAFCRNVVYPGWDEKRPCTPLGKLMVK